MSENPFLEVPGEEKFGPNVVFANPMPKFNVEKGNAKEQASICKYTEFCNVNDKVANFVKEATKKNAAEKIAAAEKEHEEKSEPKLTEEEKKALEKQAKEEIEFYVSTPEGKAEAEAFPIGDIHPSPKGQKWLAKILYKALTTNTSVNWVFH